jgi:transposase
MGVPRKQYSREFKQEAVRLVTQGGVSLAQAARDLDLNENMLGRWKKEFEQHASTAFPGQGHVTMRNWLGCAARLRCYVKSVTF